MEAEGSLDVVVVAYRSRELLRDCLASLRTYPPRAAMTVIVVDNDSDDGTAQMVRAEFPGVRLIENSDNAGFARANNQAIASGTGTYVLALNPDTRVTDGALQTMVELMQKQSDVGIAGCRLERADGSLDHAAKRSFPTVLSSLGHFTSARRRSSGRLAAYRAPGIESGPVDAVNGAFMLMRRTALDEVGLFDEGYWMYMEDLDLCFRFKQAGWVTWYEPSATVMHAKAGTSGALRRPRLNYAFHYGMLRFYRKFYATQRSPFVNAAVYAGIATKFVFSLARTELRRLVSGRRIRSGGSAA
jgi:GT2 family glycosyltransferase